MPAILVVEDNPPLQQFLIDVLEEEGYRVLAVPHGLAAMQLLTVERPALIVSDIMMPGLDGIALCEQVQANRALADIPIVLSSAGKNRPARDRCHYAAFLEKPFDLITLITTISTILQTGEGGLVRASGQRVL